MATLALVVELTPEQVPTTGDVRAILTVRFSRGFTAMAYNLQIVTPRCGCCNFTYYLFRGLAGQSGTPIATLQATARNDVLLHNADLYGGVTTIAQLYYLIQQSEIYALILDGNNQPVSRGQIFPTLIATRSA